MHKFVYSNTHPKQQTVSCPLSEASTQAHSFVHLFLLASKHRVGGLYSQLSESNLPRTHTVVRLRFKGKEAKTPYPQSVVHQ
jgi:hypothetical protein